MSLCGVGAKVEVVLNTFRSLFDVLTVGAGVAPLTRILEAAATIASTPMVALLVQDGTFIRLVAVRGLNTSRRVGDKTSSPGLDRAFGPPNIVATRDELKAFPRPLGLPPWTWAANVPIPIPSSSSGFALVCADMRSNVPRAPDIIPRLTMLASIVADEINLLATLAAQEEQISSICDRKEFLSRDTMTYGMFDHLPETSMVRSESQIYSFGSSPLNRFLQETLISNIRLRHKNDVSYYALRRWRTPIKPYQLEAIKALKSVRDQGLIDLMASEMAATASRLFGSMPDITVTSVPCGNSGEGCVAQRVAEETARRLGRPYLKLFEDIETRGSSHPRRNATRPRMMMRPEPVSQILLIDDIATSGAHIAEATRLASKAASAVMPLVWLGDA